MNGTQRLIQRTREVRDHGDDKIGLGLRPEFLQPPNLSGVIQANQSMHHHHHLPRSERPSFLEDEIVHILEPDAEKLAENVEAVENLLEIDQPDIPRIALLLDNGS